MKREIEIKERMMEIQKEIEDLNDEINDEAVQGAYFYDAEKVENLKKKIEELQDEYDNLDAFPTREKVEQEKNALNEELEDVEEELSEYRQGGIYFPTEEMIELEEKAKELIEKIAKKDEILNIIDEIEEIENDLDDLEEEKKEYRGAYFIPNEILNEIDEKEQKLEELYKKLGEYINDRKKDREREDPEGPEGPGKGKGEGPGKGPGKGSEQETGEGQGGGPGKGPGKGSEQETGEGPGEHGDDPDNQDLHPTIQSGLQIFRREFNEMPEILKKHTFSENPLLPLPGSVALALTTAGIVTGPIGWAGAAGIAALSYVGAKPLLRKITGQSKLEKQITEQFNDMDPKELKEMADYLTEERIIELKPNAVILRALNRSLRTIAQRENADLEREMNEAEQERNELLAKEEPLTESEKERLETLKKEIDDKVKEMEDNEKRAKEARRGKERISAAYKGNIRGSKILNIFHKRNSTTQEYKDALNEYADKEKEMLEADERGDAVSAAKAQKEMKETGEKYTYTNAMGLLRSPFNKGEAPAIVVSDREDHTVRNMAICAVAFAGVIRSLRELNRLEEIARNAIGKHNKIVDEVNKIKTSGQSINSATIEEATDEHISGIGNRGEVNLVRETGGANSQNPKYVRGDVDINAKLGIMDKAKNKFLNSTASIPDKLRGLANLMTSAESTSTLRDSQNLAQNIHSGANVDHSIQKGLAQTALRDNAAVARIYNVAADMMDKVNGLNLTKIPQNVKGDITGPLIQFASAISVPIIDAFKGRNSDKIKEEPGLIEEPEDPKKGKGKEQKGSER